MRTYLFTNARDENNILEWVVHHLNIGFKYIIIYDHMSINPISEIVKNFKNVYVKRLENEKINKCELMMKSAKKSIKRQADWILYLDADEFLILPLYENINDFLNNYQNYTQVAINWLNFGSNFHNKTPDGTLLENYTRCDSVFHNNMKCFVKPNEVLHVVNPHCFKMKDMNLSVGVNYQKLNHEKPWEFENIIDNLNNSPAYVAHYIFQSYETYLNRKVRRKRDDIDAAWDWSFDENTIHTIYNNMENLLPLNKYNKKNKKMMIEIMK